MHLVSLPLVPPRRHMVMEETQVKSCDHRQSNYVQFCVFMFWQICRWKDPRRILSREGVIVQAKVRHASVYFRNDTNRLSWVVDVQLL